MLVSILLISMREANIIGQCVRTLLQGYDGEFELLYSIPDQETVDALIFEADRLGIRGKLKRSPLSESGKALGKPAELNALMDMASGDYWVLCDGDVFFEPSAIQHLIQVLNTGKYAAVSGHPKSADPKTNMMAYFGHLLADAAHHKRSQELLNKPDGFFPVSGYLFAMRPSKLRAPKESLSEDAFLSYAIRREGGQIGYAPDSIVYVRYPKTLSDFLMQKKRSAGGYAQLKSFGLIDKSNTTRSFWKELAYWWYPLTYAQSPREIVWSLALYPVRAWMWFKINWEQKIQKKDFQSTWVRVESTKY